MNERNWERVGAAAGLLFVVLTVLATFLYPQQPRIDSSPAKTLAWAHDHRTGIQAGMVLGVFGSAAFLWFVGHLRHILNKAESGVEALSPIVFGAGIAFVVVSFMAALPMALLTFMDAQRGGTPDATVVRMLGDLNQVLFGPACAVTAVLLIAAGLAMLRQELLTPWLGWLCLLVAAFNVVSTVTSMTWSTYHGGPAMVIGWGAFLGFMVIVLIASVQMLLQPETSRAVTRRAVFAT